MAKCKCCEREKELRFGYCFDCVESESIIGEGLDMYDKSIPIKEGLTEAMSRLQYILQKYMHPKANNDSTSDYENVEKYYKKKTQK